MREKDVAALDLNLLRVLAALVDTRSVTRAGERLGLSQPAASRAVGRLRKALGDPLLVRTSGGYVLTPRASGLAGAVRNALDAAGAVFAAVDVDPATMTRRFRLATTDYGSALVLPLVAPALVRAAPRAQLTVVPWEPDTLTSLERGDVDLALYADEALPPDFHYRDLFVESYAAVVRAGHPLLADAGKGSRSAGLAALARYPQLVTTYPSGRTVAADDVLQRLGTVAHHVAVECPYFLTAPWIVADSDLVMVLPRRLARRFVDIAPIRVIELPRSDERFTYRLIWHERGHRDVAARWMRTLVVKACSVLRR